MFFANTRRTWSQCRRSDRITGGREVEVGIAIADDTFHLHLLFATGDASGRSLLKRDGIPGRRCSWLKNQARLCTLQHEARFVNAPLSHFCWRRDYIFDDRLPAIVVDVIPDFCQFASRIPDFVYVFRHLTLTVNEPELNELGLKRSWALRIGAAQRFVTAVLHGDDYSRMSCDGTMKDTKSTKNWAIRVYCG